MQKLKRDLMPLKMLDSSYTPAKTSLVLTKFLSTKIQLEIHILRATDLRDSWFSKKFVLPFFKFNFINIFAFSGWNNDGGSSFNMLMKDALLNAANTNVIVVDWGKGAQTINYISARWERSYWRLIKTII